MQTALDEPARAPAQPLDPAVARTLTRNELLEALAAQGFTSADGEWYRDDLGRRVLVPTRAGCRTATVYWTYPAVGAHFPGAGSPATAEGITYADVLPVLDIARGAREPDKALRDRTRDIRDGSAEFHLVPEDNFVPYCGTDGTDPSEAPSARGPRRGEAVRTTTIRDEATCAHCVAMHDAIKALRAAGCTDAADALLNVRNCGRGVVLRVVSAVIESLAIRVDEPVQPRRAALRCLGGLLSVLAGEDDAAPAEQEGSTR
jgi:hypothetical protein